MKLTMRPGEDQANESSAITQEETCFCTADLYAEFGASKLACHLLTHKPGLLHPLDLICTKQQAHLLALACQALLMPTAWIENGK